MADPCLNSSDFCYHIEYSRLMALRILREEAARQSEDECRPARAVGLRGTVINVLLKPEERCPLTPMPHMPLEFWRFHGSDRPDHYREHMHECLQLAGMTAGPEHRAVLVAMAQGLKLLAQFHGLAATPEYRHNRTLIPTHKVASM